MLRPVVRGRNGCRQVLVGWGKSGGCAQKYLIYPSTHDDDDANLRKYGLSMERETEDSPFFVLERFLQLNRHRIELL